MDYKNIVLILVCLVCLAGVSCGGFIDRFTPCEVTEQSMAYVDREFPPLGIMTLHEAKQIKERIIIKHRVSQLTAKRIAEDDKYAHDDAIKYIDSNITASENFQETVVGSVDNPMSIMGLLGVGSVSLMAGRMLKRKNDSTPAEVKDIVSRRLAEERDKLKV